MDDLADIEKIADELNIASDDLARESASHPQAMLLGLAEAVVTVNKTTEDTLHRVDGYAAQMGRSADVLSSKAETLVSDSLADYKNFRDRADAEIAEKREAGRVYFKWGIISGVLSFVVGAMGGAGAYLLALKKVDQAMSKRDQAQVEYDQFKEIGETHGARLIENASGQFILFDKGVETRECTTPNCIGMKIAE